MDENFFHRKLLLFFLLFAFIFAITSCSSKGGKKADNVPSSKNPTDKTALALSKLKFDPREFAYYPELIEYNNDVYVIMSELNSNKKIRVQKWNGSSWEYTDGASNYLNYNGTEYGYDPKLIVFNNQLYAIWYEFNSNIRQIRVKTYNGSSWTFIDGGASTGLNYDTNKNAYNPELHIHNSELYALWTEETASVNREKKAKKYNGTIWENLGSIPTEIEYNPNLNSDDPQITVFNIY